MNIKKNSFKIFSLGCFLIIASCSSNIAKIEGKSSFSSIQPSMDTYEYHTVKNGDSLWNISKKFKVSIEDVVLWNDLDIEVPLQINQEIKIFSRYERIRQELPSRDLRTMLYPVKSGDTISRIASKFEITSKDIQEWNEIEDVSKIFPGQVLKLLL